MVALTWRPRSNLPQAWFARVWMYLSIQVREMLQSWVIPERSVLWQPPATLLKVVRISLLWSMVVLQVLSGNPPTSTGTSCRGVVGDTGDAGVGLCLGSTSAFSPGGPRPQHGVVGLETVQDKKKS